MPDPVETYEHHGVTVKIHYDEIACNPRTEFDNMGTIVGCRAPCRGIGDRELSIDYHSAAEIVAELHDDGARLVLPVHYSPQGGTLSVSDADDEEALDECDGVIYVTADSLRHAYKLTRISAKALERATRVLRGEIAEYSAYLSGEVFGFVIEDEAGEHLDSCWGFYKHDYCETRATEAAEYQAQQVAAEAREAFELACRGVQTVPR
jgi:hypothetical protein